MSRVILHLDMDAFYASIEQRDHPEFQGKPVIVGSSPDARGVVCAASYEARVFGVRSAMPSRTAGRLCPKGIFVRPRMDHYRDESRRIFTLVSEFGVVVEKVSVDEAYLDATSLAVDGNDDDALESIVPLARAIQQRIHKDRGLTASLGIASNKLLAKLGSDFQKPCGLTLIPESGKVAFLRPLPVRALHGVGRVTEEILIRAGLKTVGDLQDHTGDLRALVGNWGATLKLFAMGEDLRALEHGEEIKSISNENTFDVDTEDRRILRKCLREQSLDIAVRLSHHRLEAQTVQIKVRYSDFSTVTRQISLKEPVGDDRELYRLGCWLLARHRLVHRPLRLLGLGTSGLMEMIGRQPVLPFDEFRRGCNSHGQLETTTHHQPVVDAEDAKHRNLHG